MIYLVNNTSFLQVSCFLKDRFDLGSFWVLIPVFRFVLEPETNTLIDTVVQIDLSVSMDGNSYISIYCLNIFIIIVINW